ncbi:MAG: glycosyltransferase [Nitrospinae bacterium]|nr:glycosyltransferase [Nitrospinota bacterium]
MNREKNERLIRECYPRLWEIYENSPPAADVEPTEAKTSAPVFKYKNAAFHGIYRPEEEAARLAARVPPEAKNIWVFGLGYGHHLRGLLDREADVTVYEPSPEIFKSAVEVADLTAILDKCRIVVGDEIAAEIGRASFKGARLYPHGPYPRFFEAEWNLLSAAVSARVLTAEKKIRVMVVGPIYGGSEPTFRHAAGALVRMGAEVVVFEASNFASGYFELDKMAVAEDDKNRLKESYCATVGEAAAAMAEHAKPDLVLALAQAPLGLEALERLGRLGVPLAFWFVEDYRTMGYWGQAAPRYDYFFTIQRGLFFDKLREAGAKRVAYLPQAAEPDVHRPVELAPEEREKYGSDLSFMGAGYRNRRVVFSRLLDYDLKIWGTEWDLNSELGRRAANKNERLKPEEYVKIFSASEINLNLHSSPMLDGLDPEGDFVNPRVFELAACGAFSLVDNRRELGELFKIGEEVVTFSSPEELREKIDYYLAHPEARRKVADAARRRALTHHTFERRMEAMLSFIISGEGGAFPRPKSNDGKERGNPRNFVRRMMEEGADDRELVELLAQFDPDEEFSPAKANAKTEEKVRSGSGKLTRAESLMLILEEYLR